MCESDNEISDIDIEMRTWNKLEKNMKVLGFQEGAAKGRDLSLQEGFNLGYLDGFKIGEQIGVLQAKLSLQKKEESKNLNKIVDLKTLLRDACVLCKRNQTQEASKIVENNSEALKSIISEQQSHSTEIFKCLKWSNLELKPKKG